MKCSVTNSQGIGCKNEVNVAGSICTTHRDRLIRWGHVGKDTPIRAYTTRTETADIKRLTGETQEERFFSRVVKGPECWKWDGGTQKNTGYGQLRFYDAVTTAHRAAWVIAFGEIPEGVKVRQTCGDRLCVRLTHLEAVFTDGSPFYSAEELLAA
ncbi:HNH endonuclease [Streptomyces phage Maneekul]|uniref:HNH endonuclease n=1 Tax=Streptomyces phage Yasdnil TaxID=2593360 RepID=A0A514U4C7_9CAUD|nr:HNH endonuclease [Streptomyces phage Yasdnil]AWN07433.1 HNH endonuclease [Streptomyces phage Maneekul]QDK03234.1 HNH endonuclease [Streptomyces phage TuanPN]QFP95232.1 HNH endonuclease [Streptomyces phage Whatever]QQO39987.1 HNH endonuclease [Streptomyces phage Dwayne]QYW07985.1 HNH endonuclease [Streptomyces phage Triste]USH46073.1 HNH endonuclease [Streptomyces phage Ejemplo]WAB09848.1 HNH endonuclease [Streptomyces phage TagePhighter]WNM66826.1 HNH endonuclease [Streptomyces phage Bar